MKAFVQRTGFFFLMLLASGTAASAADSQGPAVVSGSTGTGSGGVKIVLKAPLSSPLFSRFPVAVVNDEQVSVEAFGNALAAAHEGGDDTKQTGKIDYSKMLERLINVKLIIQEAVRTGLDEQPEYTEMIEAFSEQTLAAMLRDQITRDAKADPATVERLYKDLAVEWKIKSVMFEKESDAQAMLDALAAGKNFDELAEQAVADKKARGGEKGTYIKPKNLLPQIAAAIAAMTTGSVSPIIKPAPGQKDQGFIICKLEDTQYPENPEARVQAEKTAFAEKRREMLERFMSESFEKYVTLKRRRIDGLDYESPKANLDKLRADTRVIAEIEGDKPVTVGDLTAAIEKKFYHGVPTAAREKKVNPVKRQLLEEILKKRLLRNEQARRGLDKSEEFEKSLSEYKNSTLFGLFLTKMVIADIRVTNADMAAYYEEHGGEYLFPEMMRITSLVFKSRNNAESALARLKKGADINWVRSNTEGLVAHEDAEDISFEGTVLSTKALPADMHEALAGARAGEFRLYEAPGGRFCVLALLDVIPARRQPFENVSETIQGKVFDAKVNQAIGDWARKLRAASHVEVYLTGMEL